MKGRSWRYPEPPPEWQRIRVLDLHTAGEPLRIVTGGLPPIPGETMLEKRRFARENLDHLRRAVILEPRGHADMYGCIPTDPVTPDGDLGVLFIHNEGYSTMCGHGIIALATAVAEAGTLEGAGSGRPIRIDTPAGRVTATPSMKEGRAESVSFLNVPSFALATGREVDVEGIGKVAYDLAFGGAFYAYVEAKAAGVRVEPEEVDALIDAGRRIGNAVRKSSPPRHPGGEGEDLDFLYGVIFHQPGLDGVHSRNVCIFADGEVDRSPTGTGVSGRIALLHALGEVPAGRAIRISSILGTEFRVAVEATCEVGGLPAVIPRVEGSAHVTGRGELWIDPRDPLREGFMLR